MKACSQKPFDGGKERMAQRFELTFDDFVAIWRRRRWMLIVPSIVGLAIGCAFSLLLPTRYTSHTMVLVEQPVVPDNYVKPVVSEDLNERLASMQEQILSRTRVQYLIERFGLYQEEAKKIPMEVLVDRLRKSIKVTALNPMAGTRSQELPGFYVDVKLGQARLAQQICAEITSMFMEQNLRLHEQHAEDTTQFLAKQLEEAKAKLDDQDAKLAAFQKQYIGELPEDEQTNLMLFMGMNPQLEAVTQELNQAQQNKAFTESLLGQQVASWKSSQQGQDPSSLGKQLSNDQSTLLSMQARFTEKHPEVVKLKKEIAELQEKIRYGSIPDENQSSEQKAAAPMFEPPELQQLRSQLHQLETTIAQKTYEQEQLQRQVKVLQGRVQLSPVVQQQFKVLTRDYQTALNFYNDLLKKRNESQMATELERRQQGEQFRVLDPPSLPERPSFPNRPLFNAGGLAAGVFLGFGMVVLTEWRDKSIRTRKDVLAYLGAYTLAVIPPIESAVKKENRAFRKISGLRSNFGFRASV
jgi:polysaccharide chain length determinant protein (PEP-CTERM system associated)